MGRKLHLLCNAHLDPVWQWEWEEGAAAAISTFRAAADFCEEYEGFVFNHNEALLYRWVEEYEPALFARIQRLVREGRWHMMGGWYLQPDCNMPSGESIVRHIVLGRAYFRDKFGAEPTTTINFDSFGHSRGLVQIMAKAGFDSYIFLRPEGRLAGPAREFAWVGFDGSKVTAYQIAGGYNTLLGAAHKKVEKWLQEHPDKELGLLLWGVGNHGGGPSRLDLDRIGKLIAETGDVEIAHSTPERYFAELAAKGGNSLPEHADDLNPRFVGCYTSMIRVKMKHRQLENELFMTEKMAAAASMQRLMVYPQVELREATHDLMLGEFHDILPGSSIQPAEEASLRLLDHGLEAVARVKARAFFALAAGQPKAGDGEYPILVYNPHPFPVRGAFECEFMLADQNWEEQFSNPVVYRDGVRLPSQAEKEHSNLNLDWRKRVVFEAELAPSAMNRFDCRIEVLPEKPQARLAKRDGKLRFRNESGLEVELNAATGLIDGYAVNGVSYLQPDAGAFQPLVVADNEDSWRMDTDRFGPIIGRFALMSPARAAAFSGLRGKRPPAVRVIEDGDVRTVVEALLAYGDSAAVVTYKLPKRGTELEVQVRLFWNEKDKMAKLSIPTLVMGDGSRYWGQTAYGVQRLPADGAEAVAQKWTALAAEGQDGAVGMAVTLINDGVYGSDCADGVMRPTLIRSPGYCAHPIRNRPIMRQDRFSPRIDQGERLYTFWLNGGSAGERLAAVDREALAKGERPYALSFFPQGGGERPQAAVELDDGVVQLTALKLAERGDAYVLRLFEPTGEARGTTVRVPALGLEQRVELGGFEIRTLLLDTEARTLREGGLLER
ncbi:glycoside hydrolase family 38 N-terminal domain-containing protein [Paenibacillus cymbidii]|uniref:glycoside hydrolase family 38 N-terminal domain-containing protein n=1 Tax=Paenibacillus cymbidii TaxID=1639034 RepID=UPI00108035C1|nr:alpha-mannosidase [Paenibacillus cymbidii]